MIIHHETECCPDLPDTLAPQTRKQNKQNTGTARPAVIAMKGLTSPYKRGVGPQTLSPDNLSPLLILSSQLTWGVLDDRGDLFEVNLCFQVSPGKVTQQQQIQALQGSNHLEAMFCCCNTQPVASFWTQAYLIHF